MWKDKLVLIPGLITLIVLLAGTALSVTALYGWHLAIHPEPQLDRSIGPVLRRTEGSAALVAVASRREDAAALGFNAKVHGRDCSNFHRHQRRIAAQRGWYPHDGGAGQGLVAPEADLHLPQQMEADPIGWVRRHADEAVPVRTFDSMRRSWSTPPSAPA